MRLSGIETVLVVDDDPVILELIADILTPLGFTIHVASNCSDALEFASLPDKSIDMLLTDVVMPDMLGHELVDKFKVKCPQAKVLFMSGLLRPSSAYNEEDPEKSFFIQKPFTPDQLLYKMKKMM